MVGLKVLRDFSDGYKKSLVRRGLPELVLVVDKVLALDVQNRELLGSAQLLREARNELSAEIEVLKKQKKPVEPVLAKAKSIPGQIKEIEVRQEKVSRQIDEALFSLPNFLHESVPEGQSDADNVVVRKFLEPVVPGFKLKHHGELASLLGGADFERAVKISGSGFFFLKNDLALLEFALQQFAVSLLLGCGFSLVQTPLLMKRKPYSGVTDLRDFENVMYKIEGEDLFLIATSEHPIAAMFSNEILPEHDLPLKFCGVSSCFRREVGKHGLDERGFFRVHQFNKVEQFVFCRPDESWKLHEELVFNSENFLKKLGIPFEVVNVCTGDIGFVAAKKYDVNGWSPREKKYIELMSISNCTTYQSEKLGIKYRKKDGEKDLVHTLNGTMVATSRMLRVILENFQTESGSVLIPKALQPFMGGKKEISLKKQNLTQSL